MGGNFKISIGHTQKTTDAHTHTKPQNSGNSEYWLCEAALDVSVSRMLAVTASCDDTVVLVVCQVPSEVDNLI